MIEGKPIFVVLGAGGYPHKISAAGNKYFLMAKALYENGFEVNLINRSGVSDTIEIVNKDGIKCYFLISEKENQKLLSRILNGIYLEIRIYNVLRKLNGRRKYLMISYCPVYSLLYYYALSKVLKFHLILSLMEDHCNHVKKIYSKVNAYLFWKLGLFFADAALPISEYLKNKVASINNRVPVFKLPVLANYNIIPQIQSTEKKNYFLYCGSVGYGEVINFVIEAFRAIEEKGISLYLVLHGNDKLIKEYYKKAANEQRISIYTSLPELELYRLYSESVALLIPLRPIKQEIARFPQKIAEYLASGRPVITTNVGEIKHYFTDKINVIIADDYDIESYARAMQFVLDNPHLAQSIGVNGQLLGLKCFHYQSISQELSNFISSI